MSKRYNVLKGLNEQFKQGNQYIASDGSVVSDIYLSEQFMSEFTRGLRNKNIDAKTTFDDYAKKRLEDYTKVADLMEMIEGVLNRNFANMNDAKEKLNSLYGAKMEYHKPEVTDAPKASNAAEARATEKEKPDDAKPEEKKETTVKPEDKKPETETAKSGNREHKK